jgi:hypothetical protein
MPVNKYLLYFLFCKQIFDCQLFLDSVFKHQEILLTIN